ncbi:MAG: type I 3-dehydroquinate dehydratase [Candidatus Kapabacteria bacterium]|jgi:3-dehydroquinate dehydratase-1|nr:type I 3-dehydroquinate dehydratase [Candidatus Kapabacteria bacterium]
MDKLCISVAEVDFEECMMIIKSHKMQDHKLLELRLDDCDFDKEQVKHLFSYSVDIVATCRPGSKTDEQRKTLLMNCIEAGAAYIDIEIDSAEDYKKTLIEAAKAKNCKVILSYHNEEKTPDTNELMTIIQNCYDQKADIAKIACMANSEAECARTLSLYSRVNDKFCEGKLLAIAMGKIGRISRIAAPVLGAPFMYAAVTFGSETALGQFDLRKMKQIAELMK